jgi:hypothetical protein
MACVGLLVSEGHAEWRMLGGGDVELRLPTGETFRLGESALTRIG